MIGGRFQDIEQLLASAGRASFFLCHGNRNAAQVGDPRQNAGTHPIHRVALVDGLEQHRGDVFAVNAHRAGAATDQGNTTIFVVHQAGAGGVGLACRAGNQCEDALIVDFEFVDLAGVSASFFDFLGAEPGGDIIFGIGGQGDSGHLGSVIKRCSNAGEQQSNDGQPVILLMLGGNQAVNLRLQIGPRALGQ